MPYWQQKGKSNTITDFTKRVVELIRSIPPGRVATYGQIAVLAGSPRGARQVSRILHSMSKKHDLPWHRVINTKGTISLPRGDGYEEQKLLLVKEGVAFGLRDIIDLRAYQWKLTTKNPESRSSSRGPDS